MTGLKMPPRSFLFVPGNDSRKMEKASSSGADALILDLEDAVGPEEKDEARRRVVSFLSQARTLPCFVRINGFETDWVEADLAALGAAPDGFVLPKCEGPSDVARLAEQNDEKPIIAIATETVRGVRSLMRDDWEHPALYGLAWGGEDLSADMGAAANRDALGRYMSPFQLARDSMLFAAKAAAVLAIDAVYTDFRDVDGLLQEAREAQTLGFTAKLAIHPKQIAPIHEAFMPSKESIVWARQVVELMHASKGGVAKLGNQMLDQPHLKRAREILARGG